MTSLTTINNNNATSSTTTTNINNNNNNNNNNTTNNNKDKYAIAAQQALALAASTNSKAIIKKRKTMESGVSSSTIPNSNNNNQLITRASGTAGPIGASYAITSIDWKCNKCRTQNRGNALKCVKCRRQRPKGAGGVVTDPNVMKDHGWREVLDPKTQQMYYWNIKTQETKWERPSEMGQAPAGTGWYGRGAAGSKTFDRLMREDMQYRLRPAFQQAEEMDERKAQRLEGANEFNVWYGKYVGDHWSADQNKGPAETRCIPMRDAGLTVGDKTTNGQTYFCLFFARGNCAAGEKCKYIHRIPLQKDGVRIDNMHDCFGRDRHANQRDDMNGVGSFANDCRTLYVGGLKTTKYKNKNEGTKAIKAIVERHFSKWGEIENTNVIWRLSICFVRYRLRISAEFAKEAMANQALDDEEVLSLRWAYDDPNSVTKKAIQRSNQDAMFAAMRAQGVNPMQPQNVAVGPMPKLGNVNNNNSNHNNGTSSSRPLKKLKQ